jgi:hypothetical protein
VAAAPAIREHGRARLSPGAFFLEIAFLCATKGPRGLSF